VPTDHDNFPQAMRDLRGLSLGVKYRNENLSKKQSFHSKVASIRDEGIS
jgi:hypothetical protein